LYKYHEYLANYSKLTKSYEFVHKNPLTDVDFYLEATSNQYYFYQRTARCFLLWKYKGTKENPRSTDNWQLERFYSADSTIALPPRGIAIGDPFLPDTTHFLPCTITDTAFFRGHNKAIQQGNQHWLINTSHGAIYYLADYGIIKVAQIENFQNYPAALLQRRLFIEDRDKGELIFFSRLIRTDREAPLPKYRSLITPRAIGQRFGALATVPKTNRK
jgi:hypothetical protein